MSTQMDELLAQAYGTAQNISSLGGHEKTAEDAIFEELEKVAASEGIDLSELSDEDIAEILSEALGLDDDGSEKTAGLDDEDMAKLAEADFIGRTMAHAFYDEMAKIQGVGVEKFAGDEYFEAAALERANEILYAVGVTGEEKVAEADEIDEAVSERAAEILAENGYDVDQIAAILANS